MHGALLAQTTVGWNFGTGAGDASANINAAVSHLTISNITAFTGQTLTLANASASSGYTGASANYNASFATVAGAFNVNSSSAFTFTLTPASGYQVSVSSISFGSRSTASGPVSLAIRTSADNYASNVFASSVTANSVWSLQTASSLSSITGTSASPLSVRLYGYGGTSASAGNWRIDDLNVTLTVSAVPEPSTYAAIAGAVALAGVMMWRRRRADATK